MAITSRRSPEPLTKMGAVCVSLIALTAAAGLSPWLGKSLWRDEGASLYSARLGWGQLWRQSNVVDRVLLPYYSLLHLWLTISYSVQWARTLSLAAYAVTIFLVGYLGTRYFGLWCGSVAAVAAAANPLLIQAALDARPYALATMFATASVVSLLRWIDNDEGHFAWWFALFAAVAVTLQIFSVLVPLSVAVAALAPRPDVVRQSWRKLLTPVTAVVAVSGVVLVAVFSQRAQVAWIPPVSLTSLPTNLAAPITGGNLALGNDYADIVAVIGGLALAVLILTARGARRAPRGVLTLFTSSAAWALVPPIVLIVVSWVQPIYVSRYVTSSVPGAALAFAVVVAAATRAAPDRGRWRTVGVVVVALALVAAFYGSQRAARTPQENLQRVALYLRQRAGSRGEVALPDHSLYAGVGYYLSNGPRAVRLWPTTSQPYVEGLDLLASPAALAHAPSVVWLVNDGSVAGVASFVSALHGAGYQLKRVVHFPGYLPVSVEYFTRSAHRVTNSGGRAT